jgi:hypothetical protein
MVEELKPCPFCGAVTSIKTWWSYFYIEANHKKPCGFAHTTGGFGPFASEKNAITAWNTREASVAAAVAERDTQIAGLAGALRAIIQLDHHNHAAPSQSSNIARAALAQHKGDA